MAKKADDLKGRAPGGGDYIPSGNLPKAIPAGKVLVHNFPAKNPAQRLGPDGHRAWWENAPPAKELIACSCGWCPGLGKHYTRRLAGVPPVGNA